MLRTSATDHDAPTDDRADAPEPAAPADGPVAFPRLDGKTRAYVRAIALRIVKDEHAADDVAQDALLLAHRHRANGRGSPLKCVYVYKVRYNYPEPGEDVPAFLAAQNGPPNWDADGPFFVYDPATRRGRKLGDVERVTVQKQLSGNQ